MNGLEAIKFMEQGKIVKADCVGGTFLFKIENGIVKYKPYIGDWEYKETEHFCLSNEYEEYIEPKPLTGWERVERSNKYNFIDSCGAVESSSEMVYNVDNKRYEVANYFLTKEKAEEIEFKQTLFRKLQRFSDENCGNEIDWSDCDSQKYFIRFIHPHNDKLAIDFTYAYQYFGQVYFVSKEVANKAIELFHDDLIKYFAHDWNKSL